MGWRATWRGFGNECDASYGDNPTHPIGDVIVEAGILFFELDVAVSTNNKCRWVNFEYFDASEKDGSPAYKVFPIKGVAVNKFFRDKTVPSHLTDLGFNG